MNTIKETNITKRISVLTGKSVSTLNDWKKHETNYKVYEALKEYVELKDNHNDISKEDEVYIKNEIIKILDKLPKNKTKKFYYLMMAELAEIGH